MSDYTLKNFTEIDDAFAARDCGIEMRFARRHVDAEHLGVTHMRYAPNARFPFGHSHRQQEEAYVVIAGSGRAKLEDEIVELRQWDVIRVAPAVTRGLEAGPDGMELIVVGANSPAGGDGIKVDCWWTD